MLLLVCSQAVCTNDLISELVCVQTSVGTKHVQPYPTAASVHRPAGDLHPGSMTALELQEQMPAQHECLSGCDQGKPGALLLLLAVATALAAAAVSGTKSGWAYYRRSNFVFQPAQIFPRPFKLQIWVGWIKGTNTVTNTLYPLGRIPGLPAVKQYTYLRVGHLPFVLQDKQAVESAVRCHIAVCPFYTQPQRVRCTILKSVDAHDSAATRGV